MGKIIVGVIFGGRSGEHEISIRSAKTVLENIDKKKYSVIPIAISPEGKWLSASESAALLPESVQKVLAESIDELSDDAVALAGDTTYGGLLKFENPLNRVQKVDVIFPVLHGTYGEDGTIQGLFEMAGLPYVGCGVVASACGMDKVVMKTLFSDAGLPICKYVWFLRSEWEANRDLVTRNISTKMKFPVFVKPANLGSSVGISKANTDTELATAIDIAAQYDRKIIVEEGLDMRELECAVMGNDVPEASLPGEYVITDGDKKFLDYTEKYSGTGNNEFVVPAPTSDELSDKIREQAISAFKAIDGSGLARVDFFLRNDTGELLVNEINTLPGLTDASGFPKMWVKTGRSIPEQLDTLIELAFKRHADKLKNKTTRD